MAMTISQTKKKGDLRIRLRRWIGNRKLVIALTALAAQLGILLFANILTSEQELRPLVAAGIIALVQVKCLDDKNRYLSILGTAMAMTVVGALGMTMGAILDSWGRGPLVCSHCQTTSLFTWSNGLMLLFCFWGCRLFFPHNGGRWPVRFCGECFCMIGMTAGMFLGGVFLMPLVPLARGDGVDMHWVMLLGMLGGNLIGLFVFSFAEWKTFHPFRLWNSSY